VLVSSGQLAAGRGQIQTEHGLIAVSETNKYDLHYLVTL
jgi:hypothetical protein